MKIKVCENCKGEFKPSSKGKRQKFCSQTCRLNSMGKGMMKNCLECKKPFPTIMSKIKKAKFCSTDCRWSNQKKTVAPLRKTCKKCNETLAAEKFRPKRKVCKSCNYIQYLETEIVVNNSQKAANLLAAYKDKVLRIRATPENCKWCNKCKNFVPVENFCKRSDTTSKTNSNCRSCRKNDYVKNFDNISKRSKKYRAEKRPQILATKRQFYQNNKEYYLIMAINRRSRELKAKGNFSLKEWNQKLGYFGNRCYLCGDSLENKTIHKEHRIPLSRGGTNWIANIAPACEKCNRSKHTKTEKEFRQWKKAVA